MPDLQLFQNPQFGQIRVIDKDGQPWFVAADVCAALELTDTSKTVNLLDDDEKGTNTVRTPSGAQEMLIINEPGLYSLVLRSRKPEAKAFKRWICHEVIPSIRRHGGYLTPAKIEEVLTDPDTIIRLATDLKSERARREQLELKVAADHPKVVFADAVDASRTSILVGELATLMRQNGVDIGQNRLFEWLRENGWLNKSGDRYNLPTQKAMDMGLFEIKERTVNNPDGSIKITRTTKVTGKGQVYFINKFVGKLKLVAA
jgi:Prophage antirepressor